MTNRTALLSAVCLLCLAVPAGAQVAGVTAAVNQSATGVPPGGTIRTVVLGDNVVRNERIDTNSIGLVQILLADGTAFTVGPDSSVTIDSFVYDPDAGTAQVAATMTRGVLRFIGGRTSKTPNGVSLATPIGTVGIRGAVVDVNLVGSTADSCGLPAHIDLVFGQEVTLSGGGAPARVYQPGYSIVADGRQGRRVQRTPPGCASLVQSALAGRPGTTGGASEPPTETIVAQSPIGAQNSARPVAFNAPPIPTARPVNPNTVDAILVADATLDLVRIRIAQGLPPVAPEPEPPVVEPEPEPPVVEPPVVEPPVVEPEPPVVEPEPPVVEPEPPVVEPEPPVVEPEPPVEPEPVPGAVTFNVYQNPDNDSDNLFYVSDDPTRTIAAPQTVGGNNRLVGTLASGSGGVPYDLPAYSDPVPESGGSALRREFVLPAGPSVSGGQTAEYGEESLEGFAYVGSQGFRAYLLRTAGSGGGEGGDGGDGGDGGFAALAAVPPPSLFYAITGTATPVPNVFGNGDVDRYRINDRTTGGLFASPRLEVGNIPATDDTDLFVVGRSTDAGLMQSWLVFDGNQGSTIGVNVGRISSESGAWVATGTHAGSERLGGTNEYITSGTFASLLGPTGAGFFGQTGDYGVLSGTPGGQPPLVEETRNAGEDNDFPYSGTYVVSRAGPTEVENITPLTGTNNGFAAGLVVRSTAVPDSGGVTTVSLQRNILDDQVSLVFGADGSVSGAFELAERSDTSVPVQSVTFGESAGSSTAVDANRFAALGPNATYMISGRANPVVIPPAPGQQGSDVPFDICTSCDFMQWGWWGTQERTQSSGGDFTTGVHLGTFMTGDVTSVTQYNALVATTTPTDTTARFATYSGNVVGTTAESGISRTATGTFDLGWNFGNRSGGFDLTFGNRSFEGFVSGPDDGASFSGNGFAVSESGGSIALSGAFVNDLGNETGPLGNGIGAGAIGNFDASVGGWSGTGIFGGAFGGIVESSSPPFGPAPL